VRISPKPHNLVRVTVENSLDNELGSLVQDDNDTKDDNVFFFILQRQYSSPSPHPHSVDRVPGIYF
jgi:hypothetical protein